MTCGASKQKSKISSKSDGGNKKRKVQNPTRSSKESTQKKKKITQRTQGSSESEDIPSEFEECSLDQQKVRGSMKSVTPETSKQKRKSTPKVDEGPIKKRQLNATTGPKQSSPKRTKVTRSRSKERKD